MRIIKTTQALSMPGRLPTAFAIFTEYHPKSGSSIELTLKRWYLQTGEQQQQNEFICRHSSGRLQGLCVTGSAQPEEAPTE
jgi:hypothetical protein